MPMPVTETSTVIPLVTDNSRPTSAEQNGVERLEFPASLCSFGIRMLCVLIGCLFLWTALARIDLVTEGVGKFIPKGDVKNIQPPSDGTILDIFVTEGQRVSAGQKLMVMDRTPLAADVQRQQHDLEITKSELVRHKSAIDALKAAIVDPSRLPPRELDIASVGTVITDLYSAYKQMLENRFDSAARPLNREVFSDRDSLRRKLVSLRDQVATLEQSVINRKQEFATKQQETLATIEQSKKQLIQCGLEKEKVSSELAKTKEQATCYENVYQDGAISKVDYLNAEKQLDEQERSIVQLDAKIFDAQHQVEASKLSLTEIKANSEATIRQSESDIKRISTDINNTEMQIRDIDRKLSLSSSGYEAARARAQAALQKESDDYSDCQHKIEALKSALDSSKHIFEIAEIRAPVDGTVTAIKVKVKGQVVSRGEGLMTLVPSSTGLLMETKIANKDFGFIELNQKAKIKLDAFPFQDYGMIEGKVVELESQPQQEQDGTSYFNIRILPEKTWIVAQGKKVYLTNGMSAQSDIVIRNKSILELIIEPVTKLSDGSVRN